MNCNGIIKKCFMTKYIYIGFLFLLLACQKEGIVEYDLEKDSIQFNYEESQMSLSYNFAEQTGIGFDEYGYPISVYLGDSISRDTISLNLYLMGHASEVDRTFKGKAIPLELLDSLPMTPVEFYPSYTFRANQLVDTVEIILIRPEKRGHYAVGITVDTENGESIFDTGVEEQQVYELFISDRYEKPDQWDMFVDYLGEFSEEKYAFMVTVLQIQFATYLDWGTYNQVLRDALEKFNNENPNNPKDFDFPVNTKPSWWNNAITYLGEYSVEKEEFIKTIVPSWDYGSWTYWPNYMQSLIDAYNAYNQEHPDNPLPFPPFPGGGTEPEKDK